MPKEREAQKEQPALSMVKSSASKDVEYHLMVFPSGKVLCSCPGFTYKGKCRHSDEVKEQYWPSNLKEFVKDLENLSNKYGFRVDGMAVSRLPVNSVVKYAYDLTNVVQEKHQLDTVVYQL